MCISMRVLDGEQPGGVAVEWCSGDRCIRREITGPWPDGFQAVQAAVLAELADLITNAPTDMDALVAEVERLRALLAPGLSPTLSV